MSFVFWPLAALVLFTTLAPMSRSQKWWIRGWDFPRVHIAGVAIATAALGVVIGGVPAFYTALLMLVCAAYQAYRVYPYTALARTEIALRPDIPKEHQISMIAANVLMENDDHAALINILQDEQADVVLLMETDTTWEAALQDVLAQYDTVVSLPKDNYYGMIFATNLPVHDAKMVYLSDDDTPALLASMQVPEGRFSFIGLHPQPPVPGQDTHERDAQIRRASRLADDEVVPMIAMGDFNDVAWSRTAERFKQVGDFKDPRIGRGMIPSFDARSRWMRFPIDQIYLTDGLDLMSYERLAPIGSDHFPMKAVVAVQPKATVPAPSPAPMEKAATSLR